MRDRGFTLLELTVVLSIISILAIAAMPHYHSSFTEANESVVRSLLLAEATRLDIYHLDHGSYQGYTLTIANYEDYHFLLRACTDNCFQIIGGSKQKTLSIDQDGNLNAE